MLHSKPVVSMAAAVVVATAGLASLAPGASAATLKAHTPKCFGKSATIVVTGTNKTVRAPKGKVNKAGSVIVALGKGDKVFGGDGNDKICVGKARSVSAGKGNDDVQFTTGTIHGNDGNDLLQQVGKGNATVYGDAGNDKIKLAKGNSTAHGGDGNDSLSVGGSGTQKLYGDAGNDSFYAGGATATLDGGVGDDNYTVKGSLASHTFVVPGTGDKVNGQYVRVDASKNTANAVLSFNGYSAPSAYATTALPGAVLDGSGELSISNAIAPVGRSLVSWSINFGDGSPVLAGHGSPPSSTEHAFLADGGHLVTVTVTDSTGTSTARTLAVYAAKAPTSTLAATVSGATATFAITTAADPGYSAISAYSLDFGDGSDAYSGSGAPAGSVPHTYAPGSYTATLTVVDDHGSQVTTTATVTINNTTTGNPYASIQLTKQVDLTGAVAASGTYVTVGGAAAHTVELGQPFSYLVAAQPSADAGDDFYVSDESIDIGDGRGPKVIFSSSTAPVSSDGTGSSSDSISYNTPGVKTITLTVTEMGTDSMGNPLPARTTTTSTQVNVLAGVTTAQLSVPSGPEGAFTAQTAGTVAAPGASLTFYELTGPNGFDQYGVGAPPASLTQSVTPVNGGFSLTVRDSLGFADSVYTNGVVTADHPVVGDPSFGSNGYGGDSGWVGESAGSGPDDTTTGGFASAALVPSFGARITGTLINYGDGASVINAPESLTGNLRSPSAHVYTKPGDYVVTTSVTDSAKKTASNTVTVSVAGKPAVAVTGTPATAGTPTTISDTASYGVNAAAQAWTVSFDDGTPSIGGYGLVPSSFSHTFANAGSYDVRVTIDNDHDGLVSNYATVAVAAPAG